MNPEFPESKFLPSHYTTCLSSASGGQNCSLNPVRLISGEGNGTPLQYGVAKSWTRLSNFTFTFHFHPLEKEMATHSSVLAWRIPGMGEPGGLPSMGSRRVGHD